MCLDAAPSQVHMMIRWPGVGLEGVKSEVRGPILRNPFRRTAAVASVPKDIPKQRSWVECSVNRKCSVM